MSMAGSFCDICWETIGESAIADEEEEALLLPGSEGLKLLNDHLVGFFIANKLFKCSEKDSLSLVGKDDGRVEIFKRCGKCRKIVGDAWKLHCKIERLRRDLEKLGERLKGQVMQNCKRERNGGDGIGYKLRRLLCVGGRDLDKPDNRVKLEVHSDDFLFEGDEDDFDDRMDSDDCRMGVTEESLAEFTMTHQRRGETGLQGSIDSNYGSESERMLEDRGSGNRIPRIKTYDTSADGSFHCRLCESVYTTVPGIIKHSRMHEESNLIGNLYECKKCKHPNLSESKLRRHITKVHGFQQMKQIFRKTNYDRNDWCAGKDNFNTDVDLNDHDSDSDYNPQCTGTTHQFQKFRTTNRILKTAKRRIAGASKSAFKEINDPNHKEMHQYTCKLCESVYTTIPGIRKHERMHQESNLLGNKYDCPQCRHPNTSESNLRRHLTKVHLNKDNCSDPLVSTSSSEPNLFHFANVTDISDIDTKRPIVESLPLTQPSSGNFPCNRCESVYTTIPGIRKHERMHNESDLLGNQYDCPQCRHPNTSKSNLRRHLTKIHQNRDNCSDPLFLTSSSESNLVTSADVTDKSETERPNAETLSLTQPSSRNFPCNRCESVYTTIPGIRKHEGMHNQSDLLGNQYDCPVCFHPTLCEKNLRIHLTITHQNKMSREHREEIARRFPNMNLERFQLSTTSKESNTSISTSVTGVIETGPASTDCQPNNQVSDGNFRCKRCESVYTSIPGIRKHEQRHKESDLLGNKYDCPKCSHPTVNSRNLRLHMSLIHQIKIPPEKHEKVERLKERSIQSPTSPTERTVNSQNASNLSDIENANTRGKSYKQSADGDFHCELCESVYTSLPGIIKHDRMHKESKFIGDLYVCRICRHPNLSEPKLRRHMTKVHGIQQKTERRIRTEKSENEDSLMSEQENSESEENVDTVQKRTRRKTKLGSEICIDNSSDEEDAKNDRNDEDWMPYNEEDQESTNLGLHAEEDNFERPGKSSSEQGIDEIYRCEKCNVGYKCSRGLQRHEMEHKASISLGHKYDCYCGFPASSERRLRYHKKRAHFYALSCRFCNFRVQKPEQLKVHMRKHYRKSTCKSITTRRIKGRRIRIRKVGGKMECKICKTGYWYIRSYKKHMDDHGKSDLINKMWDCKMCAFPCLNEKQLERHMTKHKRRKVTCNICQRICPNPLLLQEHMRMHVEYDKAEDPETGLFCCKLCPYVGRSRRALICHKTALHREVALDTSVQYLLCPQCGKSFYTAGILRKHIKNIHENIYTYTCDRCGKGFDSKVAFTNHKLAHDKIRTKEHICDTCGVGYSHKQTLMSHIAKYHSSRPENISTIQTSVLNVRRFPKEKEYPCKWCHAKFSFKYMLVSHMSSAHQDLYTFSCDKCDKKYITASSLKLHKEITHSDGSQAVTCEHCQKVFVHRHYATCHYKFCEAKKKADQAVTNE